MNYEKLQWKVLIDHPITPLVHSHEYVINYDDERLDLGTREERETGQLKRICRLEESRNVGETHATANEECGGW
jgi:hypothetical protein